ncbi:hypothetical protein EBU99_13435 [bacterium]|nr:hypothetical protein [bacterium]
MNWRPQAIKLLSPDDVMRINRKLGEREQVVYTCLDKGLVESAVFAAFYPGLYPLANGGVAEVAGALMNGYELKGKILDLDVDLDGKKFEIDATAEMNGQAANILLTGENFFFSQTFRSVDKLP